MGEQVADPLGYLADTARTKDETIELTSELLADVIKLAHPDCHPPEREELARRTTQALLALQPFVFPAPKPKPPPEQRNEYSKSAARDHEKAVAKKPAYPCADCRNTVPYFYCDPCQAEWDRQGEKERESKRIKRRKWYARRKARLLWKSIRPCAACGTKFKGKRNDARFALTPADSEPTARRHG